MKPSTSQIQNFVLSQMGKINKIQIPYVYKNKLLNLVSGTIYQSSYEEKYGRDKDHPLPIGILMYCVLHDPIEEVKLLAEIKIEEQNFTRLVCRIALSTNHSLIKESELIYESIRRL